MPALYPAPARPAGANRHLELTDEHARDRHLFLHLGGHTRRLQHPAAVASLPRTPVRVDERHHVPLPPACPEPRILVFQPPIALVQPRDLALDPLKVAPQSFRRFPPQGRGRLLRVSLPSHIASSGDVRGRDDPAHEEQPGDDAVDGRALGGLPAAAVGRAVPQAGQHALGGRAGRVRFAGQPGADTSRRDRHRGALGSGISVGHVVESHPSRRRLSTTAGTSAYNSSTAP